MAAKHSERLSNVDTAWLRMEDPTNLMMVTGVLVFDRPLNFERLRATFEKGVPVQIELMHRDPLREGKTLVGPPRSRATP